MGDVFRTCPRLLPRCHPNFKRSHLGALFLYVARASSTGRRSLSTSRAMAPLEERIARRPPRRPLGRAARADRRRRQRSREGPRHREGATLRPRCRPHACLTRFEGRPPEVACSRQSAPRRTATRAAGGLGRDGRPALTAISGFRPRPRAGERPIRNGGRRLLTAISPRRHLSRWWLRLRPSTTLAREARLRRNERDH